MYSPGDFGIWRQVGILLFALMFTPKVSLALETTQTSISMDQSMLSFPRCLCRTYLFPASWIPLFGRLITYISSPRAKTRQQQQGP
ncbi:hypothetical protein EMPG_14655 [Blastomyces silverae]|uniref:Secreted protein n=1 Tax=Blastomyces silverae TaxID=2060906 RepID=A0A0H1BL87_9EURO|nr:hypothetical protein EMPG_14655 [Blastomyces silverae]